MKSEVKKAFSIQSPLFVFDRAVRGTGVIRKTCIFLNETEETLGLEVAYGFKEHSWLQILMEHAKPDPPDRLVLDPGETRVHFLINTDSSNFPYERFLGRVYFREAEAEAEAAERWIEINFECIEELRDFDGYAAIDLGTCNSTLSLYDLHLNAVEGMPWNPVFENGSIDVPSAVFIRDFAGFRRGAAESTAIGTEALRTYRSGLTLDPRSLQLGTKRLIGSRRVLAVDGQGSGGYVDPVDLLTMLARFIRERAQNHRDVNARLKRLMVTFPPTWDYNQINRWKEVFRRLGFEEDELDLSLDEASAAGLFTIYQWVKEEDSRNHLLQDLLSSWQEVAEGAEKGDRYTLNLLSYDFGGGTTDLAFIQAQITTFKDVIRLRIALKGSDSLNYGGDRVTLAIFRVLKRRLALALHDPDRYRGRGGEAAENARLEAEETSGFFLLPATSPGIGSARSDEAANAGRLLDAGWTEIEAGLPLESLGPELEEAVDAVFPTRFQRSSAEPISIRAKRNFGWLWDRAEMMKREMFREANQRAGLHAMSGDGAEDVEGAIRLREVPPEVLGRSLQDTDLGEIKVGVTIGEVYRAIREPLETALERARRLVGDARLDRVVLTGQSNWIPLVRRLFTRARSEGGFGVAPEKIAFDAANAKAAVSKGACILRVMRDTLVGFEVDVADFKANLLSDIFYNNTVGGRRVLFSAGAIDDFSYVEEAPDPRSFAEHLAIFYGGPETLLGQFDFRDRGQALPAADEHVAEACRELGREEAFPEHAELLRLREQDHPSYVRTVSAMVEWPERVLIAWMERTAASPEGGERPIYRYYLTRNRNLVAVRDAGGGEKRLFTLQPEGSFEASVPARENPFSGIH